MVDYSKFDTLAAELSDDDEAQGRRPVVTRLQAGSQVTIGRTGAVVSEPGPLAPSARPKAANLPHVRPLLLRLLAWCPGVRRGTTPVLGAVNSESCLCVLTALLSELRRLLLTTVGGTSLRAATGAPSSVFAAV